MKRIYLLFLALLTFFFMKNNTFAATTTCKYSLSNVSRQVVAFDDYGNAYLDKRAQSEISDSNDHNLVMTIVDPTNVNIPNLGGYVSFSIEGSKFTLANAAAGHDLTKTYDIYYYKVNNEYSAAINALKSCPQLGVLFEETSSNKYTITNITANTTGLNVSDLVKVYKMGYGCTNAKKLLCYYGSPENNYQTDKIASSYEILASQGNMGLYKLTSTISKTTSNSSAIRVSDFECKDSKGTYYCPPTTYFVEQSTDGKTYPASFKVTGSDEVKTLQFVTSYALSNTPYFMKVSLYDPDKNSGKSGNPDKNKNGTTTNNGSSNNSNWVDNGVAFSNNCDLNPSSEACRNLLSNKNSTKKLFSFCNEKGVLKALKIVNIVVTIAKILVPILLIIYGSINYGKAALSDDHDALEKTTQSLIKKVIVGLMIFLIPTIFNALISFSQSSKDKTDSKTGEFSKCALCLAGDKSCNSYIQSADN